MLNRSLIMGLLASAAIFVGAIAEAHGTRPSTTSIVAESWSEGGAGANSTAQGNVVRGAISATGGLATQDTSVSVGTRGNPRGSATAQQVTGAASGAIAAGTGSATTTTNVGVAGASGAAITVRTPRH